MNENWQWIYDGQRLAGIVEQQADGWHVIIERSTVAVVETREAALDFLDTKKNAR